MFYVVLFIDYAAVTFWIIRGSSFSNSKISAEQL